MNTGTRLVALMDSVHYYKRLRRASRLYEAQKMKNGGSPVHYYNWWDDSRGQDWFTQFFQSRGLVNGKQRISLCSVFGDRLILKCVPKPKIFFSGENVKSYCPEYSDYYLGESDLSLGMEYFECAKYLRFPLWIRYIIPPDASKAKIDSICQNLNRPSIENKNKFMSIISRHDSNGLKSQIYGSLKAIGHISCPSVFNHNDDTLVDVFGDNKVDYLKQFFFNVCPENTNCKGYVTEKLFESIQAGCIPIYWGGCGEPENEVLNSDAIIYWDKDGDNTDTITLIDELYSHKDNMIEFAVQPRLKQSAGDFIAETLRTLEKEVREIIKNC